MSIAHAADPIHKRVALAAFWTDHPLCQMYALAYGHPVRDRWHPAESWSLRELIAFAAQLPEPVLSNLERRR